MKKIKIAKCAYIFESNRIKYGTRDQIQNAQKYEKFLEKQFHDNYSENEKNLFNFEVETVNGWNGETFKKIIVDFGGEIGKRAIKDLRSIEKIISVDGEEFTEEEKKINMVALLPDLSACEKVKKIHFFIDKNDLRFDDFSSFWLENFQTDKEDLNYLRISFNRNKINFRLLTNGEIVTAEGLKMNALTNGDILEALGVESAKAKKKIAEVLNALRSAVAIPWWELED